MDTSKGLFSDSRPQSQPEGFIPFGKNGLASNIKGALENEPGFKVSAAQIPYKYIGVIETDKFPVIISTNNVNSAIGYFDYKNDLYIPIYDDAALPFKFGFSTDFYVTGQAQRNHKGEIVIALTDKRPYPLYINCDSPTATTLESLYFFPRAVAPTIKVSQDIGGALAPGAYYVLARYVKKDGTETSFLSISDVTTIKGTPGILSDKSLVVTLSEVDQTYDEIQLAILTKIEGITKVVLLASAPISGTEVTQVFSGAELTEDITLEEVLINPAAYRSVGTFGQLNDSLYAGNLEKEPEINMQRYANLVKINWISDLIQVVPSTQEHINGTRKHFMHQEVYCLYIQYSLTIGGWSRYFHIPGVAPTSADLAISTEVGSELLDTGGVPKYKVEDTIHSYSTPLKTGEMGVWINENETYPNTEDYNSVPMGPDLRGQKVRHHRFPSIIFCKESLYSGDPEYGKTKLDLLGIKASNVIIPTEMRSKITGWRLVYAKRTIANSTVIGQSVLLHAAREYNSSVETDFISTGGNWDADVNYRRSGDERRLNIDRKSFRFHSFDMLFNQPAVSPTYLAPLLREQRYNIAFDGGFIEDYSITPDKENGPLVYLIDYALSGIVPTIAPPGKRIRKIKESSYIPVNVVTGKWKNLQQESTYAGLLQDTREVITQSELSYSSLITANSYQPPDMVPFLETTYLTNLMSIKDDIGKPFTSQTMTSAGQRVTGATGDFWGGDCFLNDYTFHTYGWNDAENRGYAGELGGIKVARRFICEAVSNINLRYEVPGNIYSKWYPNSPLTPQDPNNYILAFNRKLDPNQFGYNRDLSSVNEFIFGTVFDPTKEDITKFPFRVHRGGKLSRQDKRRSWRTFLPLDYYEAQKNMGEVINLEGFQDRLIIHHENALFLTQGKLQLENGLLGIVIGSGDIFANEPQEELPTKLGYAGTQHDLACVKTPIGYLFIDSKQGQVFIFNGKLQLANNGINNFLRDYMRIEEKNVFISSGYTIGYDTDYKRFLLTAKSKRVTGKVRYDYVETPGFFASLNIGDIVYKNGRYQKFLGINDGVTVHCDNLPEPEVNSLVFTIPETTLVGTLIGPIPGTGVEDYIIVDNDGTFHMVFDKLYLNSPVDYETKNLYVLQIIAKGPGGETPFTVTVHITNVIGEPPIAEDDIRFINENSPINMLVHTVRASDPAGLALTYTITGGNTGGAFSINSGTGEIRVASLIDYETTPFFDLTVVVSNGTKTATCLIKVSITNLPEAPQPVATSITILDSTPEGPIGVLEIEDPEGGIQMLQTISESTPGVFSVHPLTGEITLNDNSSLNAGTTPTYTLGMRATDNSNLHTDFNLLIHVNYDPETIIFEPFNPVCQEPGGGAV